jgi:glycosyltransferase involved in cell wall biosynthesis
MKELVSIITPSYNTEKFISETIESVLNQKYTNWEMIIVDDGSSDKSISIIQKYIADYPTSKIYLLQNENNLGPALSRNKAIEKSSGRFLAFLDSDDCWTVDKLIKQVAFMKKKNAPFTCTYFSQITEDGVFMKNVDNIPSKLSYSDIIKSNTVGCLTAVYDVSFFGKVYMKNIAKRQDYVLWLSLLKKTEYVYCIPDVLGMYRLRKNSVSSNKFTLIKYHWHIYYVIEKKGLLMSCYYLIYYILNTFLTKVS